MVSQWRSGTAALALGLGTVGLLYACGSSDDTSTGGSTATTSSHGGSGGHGGAAGHGGHAGGGGAHAGQGGTAGSGGAPLTPSDVCTDVCDAMASCINNGSGGAAGAGGGWVQSCIDPCLTSLGACTQAEFEALLACMSPHILPDCNFAAYNVCANATGCVDNG